jgi:glycosyltransferase involved in cell wall biosynthesis
MKSVIMVANAFPPYGVAGVYRPLRFVRHLAKTGWCTRVITTNPYCYERYDPDLLDSVPSETKIIRVRKRDPWQAMQTWRGQRIYKKLSGASAETVDRIRAAHSAPLRSMIRKMIQAAAACYYQPDGEKRWIGPAVEATVKLCARKRPNVIWATASPLSAWIVAQRASAITGVPYVLDLRDPIGLSYYEPDLKQPEWVKRRTKRLMYQLFKGAQSVVFLFDSVAESYYRVFPGALDVPKVYIIPNGYDGTISEFAPTTGDKFTVLYAGTVGSYRYDTLLQALASFKKADPGKAGTLRFHFVGEGMDDLAQQAAMLGLSDIVATSGPTSHAEITRLEREADALLVLGRLPSIKGYELFAGAKVFNYLKTNRPIIGVLPQDETKKILDRVGVSTVASVDAPPEIVAILRQLWDAWSEGNLRSFLPDRAKCELYSAERQTEALVRALEGAPAAVPFVPGAVEIPPSLQEEMVVNGGQLSTLRWT